MKESNLHIRIWSSESCHWTNDPEVEPEGIGPSFPDCRSGVLPLDDGPEARECCLTPPAIRLCIRSNFGDRMLQDEEVEPRISPTVEPT